jgi:hypothetical protein
MDISKLKIVSNQKGISKKVELHPFKESKIIWIKA